jgi:hypothetical protein
MNGNRLEDVIAQMTKAPSRRDILRSLAGAGMALGLAWQMGDAEAKKRRKRKRKRKVKVGTPNEFGCLCVGQVCRDGEQCCSGICEGKEGRQTCRVHGAGTCSQQDPGICSGVISGCNDGVNCLCLRTTAESVFCGNFSTNAILEVECGSDADCEALGLPRASACVPVSEGFCSELFESDTICIAPCGLTIPVR